MIDIPHMDIDWPSFAIGAFAAWVIFTPATILIVLFCKAAADGKLPARRRRRVKPVRYYSPSSHHFEP